MANESDDTTRNDNRQKKKQMKQRPILSKHATSCCHHSCTRVWGLPVLLHLSRYTCRSRFPGVFMYGNGIALHPPVKGPVAPIARKLPRVSHVKLPLKRFHTTGGCSNYTCEYRATLRNDGCHPLNRNTAELRLSSACFALVLQYPFFHMAAWPI